MGQSRVAIIEIDYATRSEKQVTPRVRSRTDSRRVVTGRKQSRQGRGQYTVCVHHHGLLRVGGRAEIEGQSAQCCR